jgi:hypothetical protein
MDTGLRRSRAMGCVVSTETRTLPAGGPGGASPPFDLDRPWRLDGGVAAQPEPFGTMLYHFGMVCLVNPIGDVYACPFMIHPQFRAGNVRQPGRFEQVWGNSVSSPNCDGLRPATRARRASSTDRVAADAWQPSSSPDSRWTVPTLNARKAMARPRWRPAACSLSRARPPITPGAPSGRGPYRSPSARAHHTPLRPRPLPERATPTRSPASM